MCIPKIISVLFESLCCFLHLLLNNLFQVTTVACYLEMLSQAPVSCILHKFTSVQIHSSKFNKLNTECIYHQNHLVYDWQCLRFKYILVLLGEKRITIACNVHDLGGRWTRDLQVNGMTPSSVLSQVALKLYLSTRALTRV